MSEELPIVGEEALVEGAFVEGALVEEPQAAGPAGSAADGSPAAVAAPEFRRRPDPLFHWTLLLLCAAVVGLSIVLSVRDQRQVLLPVLGTPLPELCMAKRF